MRLSRRPETVWTGVVISENGEILTTSEWLGDAPVVDIRFWDGTQAQACVTGRDDEMGLALLRPLIEPAGGYDYLALSGDPSFVGQQLELLEYSSPSPFLDRQTTRVVEHKPAPIGLRYLRIDASDRTTAGGAVLLNEGGRMQGMRMPILWSLLNSAANPGEVIAIDAPDVADFALPALRSGRMHVQPVLDRDRDLGDAPPRFPTVFNGEVTIDGAPVPVDTLLHARLSKEGQPDVWQSTSIGISGEYVFPVSSGSIDYYEGTVEFWADCKRSATTAAYELPSARAVELSLAF